MAICYCGPLGVNGEHNGARCAPYCLYPMHRLLPLSLPQTAHMTPRFFNIQTSRSKAFTIATDTVVPPFLPTHAI